MAESGAAERTLSDNGIAGLHFVLLFAGTHRVSSADSEVYRLIDEDLYRPIESHFDDEGARRFRTMLAANDTGWFEVTVRNNRGSENILLRIGEKTNSRYIWLILAQPSGLAASYEKQTGQLEAFRELVSLRTSLLFHFLPDRDRVDILAGGRGRFDRPSYSSEEFEQRLLEGLQPDNTEDRNGIRTFLTNMRGGMGEFSCRVKGDLLTGSAGTDNDAPESGQADHTLIFCRTVYHSNGEEGVAGMVKPESEAASETGRVETDKLTGLLSKDEISRVAKERLSGEHPEGTTLAILDVDYFKSVNDTFGHRVGDTVLRRIANIISAELSGIGAAGRFGGDEFFLVLYISDEDAIRGHMRNIKNLVRAAFPEMGAGGTQPLSVSIGSASAPRDADNYDDLFMLADYCVYLAKFKGRDRYIIYTPEKHQPIDQIRKNAKTPGSLVTGREAAPGDILVDMTYRIRYGDPPQVESLLTEFASEFRIDNVILFRGCPFCYAGEGWNRFAGAGVEEDSGKEEKESSAREQAHQELASCVQRLDDHLKEIEFRNTRMIVINTMLNLPDQFADIRESLRGLDIESSILIDFRGKSGQPGLLMLNALKRKVQWNQQHFMYFRIFADLLGEMT